MAASWMSATDIRLFRFKEQLVAVAVAKTVDLVFDARTVARALAVNAAAEHGTVLEAATQDVVRLDIRARNPANAIVTNKFIRNIAPEIIFVAARNRIRHMAVAHGPRNIVSALHVAFVKIDGIRIQAARSSCFKTTERNPFASEAFRQLVGTGFAHSPTDAGFKTGEHLGGKERSARNHQ